MSTRIINEGWLAGILDGEGCIFVSKPQNNTNGRHRFEIRVIITNSSKLLLKKVENILRELQIQYKLVDNSLKRIPYIIITKKVEIVKILELVLSELTCKKYSAEVVMEYIKKWPDSETHWGRKGAPEQQIKDYIKIYNILKEQKGKSFRFLET